MVRSFACTRMSPTVRVRTPSGRRFWAMPQRLTRSFMPSSVNYAAEVVGFCGRKFLYSVCRKMDFGFFQFPSARRGRPRSSAAQAQRPAACGRISLASHSRQARHPPYFHQPESQPRSCIWNTTEKFDSLARQYADDAGLRKFANESVLSRTVQNWGQKTWSSRHGSQRLTTHSSFASTIT